MSSLQRHLGSELQVKYSQTLPPLSRHCRHKEDWRWGASPSQFPCSWASSEILQSPRKRRRRRMKVRMMAQQPPTPGHDSHINWEDNSSQRADTFVQETKVSICRALESRASHHERKGGPTCQWQRRHTRPRNRYLRASPHILHCIWVLLQLSICKTLPHTGYNSAKVQLLKAETGMCTRSTEEICVFASAILPPKIASCASGGHPPSVFTKQST